MPKKSFPATKYAAAAARSWLSASTSVASGEPPGVMVSSESRKPSAATMAALRSPTVAAPRGSKMANSRATPRTWTVAQSIAQREMCWRVGVIESKKTAAKKTLEVGRSAHARDGDNPLRKRDQKRIRETKRVTATSRASHELPGLRACTSGA